MTPGSVRAIATAILVAIANSAQAQTSDDPAANSGLDEITVSEKRVANERPAGTYAAATTMLRFDPATELQSRGFPEGQADVTVRGGLFENTGFKVGAVTVTDPQTGHYAAELPIDPALLSLPDIRTGIDNSLGGFNSNVATVVYSLPPVRAGGTALVGAGEDSLNFQALRFATVSQSEVSAATGVQFSAARSKGDGTIDNGDHEFERYNLQVQRARASSQTDIILGYQDKFYGWPGAYTGFATLPETDHTRTLLLLANHRGELSNGWFETGAYYRELEDDYDFDRTTQESGGPGSFDHETRVFGVGLQGQAQRGDWNWNYAAQLASDELVKSTDLTEGNFTSRKTGSFSVVPSLQLAGMNERSVILRAGLSIDISSRDSNEVLPVLGLSLRKETTTGSRTISLDYASTSQLPGYTALNSGPTGLFGGNPDLGRERADELSLSFANEAIDWHARVTAFYRKDDGLVDWTYVSGAPFARQANDVDIDVVGLEIVFRRNWESLDLVAGYTFLDKDADYDSAIVDASFYALNFAHHRATLAIRYRFTDRLELRVDNEYREQEENPLRASSDNALLVSAALAWEPENGRGLGFALTADNVGDDDYQQFPGTPAAGRQVSLSARYDW